jgi:S-adenosylmethionine hydrolase
MRFEEHYFVLPDNGLCRLILGDKTPQRLVHLDRPEYFLPRVSASFHGRDIFAPVGAHLVSGTKLDALGTTLSPEMLAPVDLPAAARRGQNYIVGSIVQVDRFGNLTTNIDLGLLEGARVSLDRPGVKIHIGHHTLAGLSTCYADAPRGQPVALIGSRGLLEIAVNQDHAGRYFGARRGDTVRLEW